MCTSEIILKNLVTGVVSTNIHALEFEYDFASTRNGVPPFKVAQSHWNLHRSIGDLLFVFHSNYGTISYHSRDKKAIGLISKFPHSLVFNAPAVRVPLGIL